MNAKLQLKLRLQAANLLLMANATNNAVEEAKLTKRAEALIGIADAQADRNVARRAHLQGLELGRPALAIGE